MKRIGWVIGVLVALAGCGGTTRGNKDDKSLFSDGSPGITGGASGFGGSGASARSSASRGGMSRGGGGGGRRR